MKQRLKYVDRFEDRTGVTRYYFRKPGGKRIKLPGPPGSAAFLKAYQAALEGAEDAAAEKKRGPTGTVARLVQDYYESIAYKSMKPPTRGAYRKVIDRWILADKVGHRLVTQMTSDHVDKMVARRADTPGAANDLLKKIRLLMNFAIRQKLRTDNPAVGHKKFPEGEFHTWTDEECAAFERKWPVGGKERFAYALHLYTGQRTSDVRKMSWSDIDRQGLIQVVQQKTGNKVWIPQHRELRAILRDVKREHHALLTTAYGKPFSTKGLGNFMAEKIGKAELPEVCVTHGLRKAAARRLAEAGCSAMQIAAITGHSSLEEVERYVRAANQKKLALAAMKLLEEHDQNEISQTEAKSLGNEPKTEAGSAT